MNGHEPRYILLPAHLMNTDICRTYLALLSLYHVVTGVLSFAFPRAAMRFYKRIYGCDPEERRQLMIVMKPWGALAFFAGLCGGFAAVDPARYRGVVVALVVLLILRVVFRVACRSELAAVGRIAPIRNGISIAAIMVGVVILSSWLLSAGTSAV